ncbi:hypothetical protein TL16_g05195 [Triparma laevis f. inornata]|uniref:Uncharacterized protein n=1 Tax=Triparma laevis f. inornata TaxID=1714386 RepID=A0A9W7EB26_9STRA|nr:hypothetical protein TL16_g05195 [Triparma laevis f. inornata]
MLINATFFTIVWKTKLLVFFPCSLFKDRNLNNLAELLGAGATLAGNLLTLTGSISPNNHGLVNVLGTIFAIMNLSFLVVFVYGFYVDMKKTGKDKQALIKSQTEEFEDGRTTSMSRAESISEKLAGSVKEAEVDFDNMLVSLAMVGEKGKEQVAAELPFIRPQVVLALRKELEKTEKGWKGKEEKEIGEVNFGVRTVDLKIVLGEYRDLLERVNVAVSNYTGKSISELEGLEDIAKGNGFEFCLKILAGVEASASMGGGKF